MNYKLPIDYQSIFANQTLIITGAGRSGTTIMGKLLGSMSPTYYLFEPKIFKLLCYPQMRQSFLAILFEDYFLPIIQGNIINDNPTHKAYKDYYWATNQEEIRLKRRFMPLRQEALHFIKKEKPIFIIKIVNAHAYKELYKRLIPMVKFFHIARNGEDVIRSSLGLGWYSGAFDHMRAEWCSGGANNIPWYLNNEMKKYWKDWKPITRAAYIWIQEATHTPISLNYERLIEKPESVANYIANGLGLEITDLTKKHIESIKKHIPAVYESINCEEIEEPIKSKFEQIMSKLGY